MKAIYETGATTQELEVTDFYQEVSKLLAEEDLADCPKEVTVRVPEEGEVVYRIAVRSGTRFITEIDNSLPDELADMAKARFLTCVDPAKNAYKFYKLEPKGEEVIAEYGRMGTQKGELFGARTFAYPKRMFWIKYQEKLSKGYVDRTELYLPETVETKELAPAKAKPASKPEGPSAVLFQKLKALAKKAVEQAEVRVPVNEAIIWASKDLLAKLYDAVSVEEFNGYLLELISILQRPVRTGDGTGVRRLMAASKQDFASIVHRESDLIQAMEGSIAGTAVVGRAESFDQYQIEVYEATEKQRKQVFSHLGVDLQKKVKQVYRVIPKFQQERFNEYLKIHKIRQVKQLWHGSRNENWMSIIRNSLLLNPDAKITGKMFGNGVYFAPSAAKSWNYTSYRGTYWAGGSSNVAYMGLYAVAYGTPYDTDTWSGYLDYQEEVKRSGKDCLHAHAGSALRNDEIVFYDEAAMVLNYIVEFE